MRAACSAILLVWAIGRAQTPSFSFIRIDPPESRETTIIAIDNSGQILGQYERMIDPPGRLRSFLRNSNGTYSILNVTGTPAGMNNMGQIVGWYSEGGRVRGFVQSADGSARTTFDAPGGDGTMPYSINDRGEVVGTRRIGSAIEGFLRNADGTNFTTIRVPGSGLTTARGINNSGEIVGWYAEGLAAGPRHGFLRAADGTYTTIDVPGGEGTHAVGINNRGQIAGYFTGGHGFVRNADGAFVVFDAFAQPGSPPVTITAGINDAGQIAGSGGSSGLRGFLALPIAGGAGPAIRPILGAMSATGFGGIAGIAPGSWVEIFGQSLSGATREWQSADFSGNAAPNSLDGVSVTIDGEAAFISYISPGQINAQVPSTVTGDTAQIVVTNNGQASAPHTIALSAVQPGLLAIRSIADSTRRYVLGLFPDGTFVLPAGARPSFLSRRAKLGETITLYGIGFGPVTPDLPAGQIATEPSRVRANLAVMFNAAAATVMYAGLTPGAIGLYQFNVVVPPGVLAAGQAFNDLVSVNFTIDGRAVRTQTLYTAVER